MLVAVVLTGWREVVFYMACAFIAIDFFATLPRVIKNTLCWFAEIRHKKIMLEKNRTDELLVREIEKKIELYQSDNSIKGLSDGDKQILGAKISALEDIVERWNNNKYYKN